MGGSTGMIATTLVPGRIRRTTIEKSARLFHKQTRNVAPI